MYRLAIGIAILLLLLGTGACNWLDTGTTEPTATEAGGEDPGATPAGEDQTAPPNEPADSVTPAEKPAPGTSPAPPQAKPKPAPRPNPPADTPSPPRREPPAAANDPAPSSDPAPETPRPADPAPAARSVVLEAGSPIEVRLVSGLSSDDNQTGQRFEAILDSELTAGGRVVASPGSRVVGRLKEVLPGGKVKGKAQMTINLIEVELGGRMVDIETNDLVVQAESSTGKDTKLIGITTGIGAAIGAVVGGGKGAAIGAAIGGGAGTARVLTTRGKVAALQKEQLLGFRIEKPVSIPVSN